MARKSAILFLGAVFVALITVSSIARADVCDPTTGVCSDPHHG